VNVARLKGVAVYAAASGGGQGDVDKLPPGANNFTGDFIEGIVNDSTRQFADAAAAAGVPITYVVRPEGSHSWVCSSRRCRSPGTPPSARR
jgi:diacylglycerol O-acyltransferase / trehalose O-mycolyltransferase